MNTMINFQSFYIFLIWVRLLYSRGSSLTWPLLDPLSLENLFLGLFSPILLVFTIAAMVSMYVCMHVHGHCAWQCGLWWGFKLYVHFFFCRIALASSVGCTYWDQFQDGFCISYSMLLLLCTSSSFACLVLLDAFVCKFMKCKLGTDWPIVWVLMQQQFQVMQKNLSCFDNSCRP